MALAPVLLASEAVNAAPTWLANIPAGKYEAFGCKLVGTASAAQTLAEVDIGRVRLTEQGRDLVNADYLFLRRIQTLKAGVSRVNLVVAAASQTNFVIPRGYYDDNIHTVIPGDNLQLLITFGAAWPTVFATGSATWRLYGFVRQTGQMRYNYKMLQQVIVTGAATAGTFTLKLTDENVCAIYVECETGVANFRVLQDGETVVNVVDMDDLNDFSDTLNNTDSLAGGGLAATSDADEGTTNNAPRTGNSNIAEVQLANPGEVGEFLSDEVWAEASLTAALSGNGLDLLVCSADFSPNKLRQSQVDSASVFRRKMERKETQARTRPLQALRIAREG